MVSFYRIINGEAHRSSPDVLSQNLSDCFVQIEIWIVVGEFHAEYLLACWQTKRDGASLNFFFKVNPLGGEFGQHPTKGVHVGGRRISTFVQDVETIFWK